MSKDRSFRRHLSFKDWPASDVAAWNIAIAEGDILDGQGPAAHWAVATKRTNCQHYSRWLGYLVQDGGMAIGSAPEDRVTTDTVKAYVAHLRSELAPRTVVSSLVGLKVMMKAMAPRSNWRWLADSCNALNRSSKPKNLKTSRMRPTGEVYATAITELDRLLATPLARRIDRVAYRDALMLAMMAARPLRLKNFTNIRIGKHLLHQATAWVILIPGEETKNGQTLEYALPSSLNQIPAGLPRQSAGELLQCVYRPIFVVGVLGCTAQISLHLHPDRVGDEAPPWRGDQSAPVARLRGHQLVDRFACRRSFRRGLAWASIFFDDGALLCPCQPA
jgi:hypothetical protein